MSPPPLPDEFLRSGRRDHEVVHRQEDLDVAPCDAGMVSAKVVFRNFLDKNRQLIRHTQLPLLYDGNNSRRSFPGHERAFNKTVLTEGSAA
jgi:hypothetical protein